MNPPYPKPSWSHPVLLWSIIFIIVRCAFLLANDGIIFDAAGDEVYTERAAFSEEFNNTTTARELNRGNSRMLDGIIQCGYGVTGGEYYQMLLQSVIMTVFGESYYAVKILPVAFSFLTFLFLLVTIQGLAGNRAAHIFAPIYIFSFPSYLLVSFYGMGNHMELALFIAIGLMCILYLLQKVKPGFVLPAFFALGLATGFAIFYNLLSASYCIWLAPMGIWAFFNTWRHNSRRRAISGAIIFVLGIAVGFSPYLPIKRNLKVPYNIELVAGWDISEYGGIGMPGFEKQPLGGDMIFLQTFSGTAVTKEGLKKIFIEAPKRMYFFKWGFANIVYSLAILITGGLFVFAITSRRGPPEFAVTAGATLGFIIIHLAFVSTSSQSIQFIEDGKALGYRYLAPMVPFLFFWLALVIDRAMNSGGWARRAATITAVFLLILGLYGFGTHFTPTKQMKFSHLKGYNYGALVNGAGDYFREYKGTVDQKCDQIRLYLSNCDPEQQHFIQSSIDQLCEDGGSKMKPN